MLRQVILHKESGTLTSEASCYLFIVIDSLVATHGLL